MSGVSCVIVVAGTLDCRFDRAFEGLELTPTPATSTLSGQLLDQAQLQGVMRQLFDLGLEIVSVTTSETPPS